MKRVLLALFVTLSISTVAQNKQMIDQVKLSNGKTIYIFSDKSWEYKKEMSQAYTNGKNQKAFTTGGKSSKNTGSTNVNDSTAVSTSADSIIVIKNEPVVSKPMRRLSRY